MLMENMNYDTLVHKLDSLWQPLLESPDFNEEEYEDNYMEYSRWKHFWENRIGGLNTQNSGFYNTLYSRFINTGNHRTSNCNSGQLNSNWKSLGPGEYPEQKLGFVQSIAMHPTNSQILYAGSENGGLFKSVNGGQTWENKTNGLEVPGLGIMDIQIDPNNSNNMVASTGGKHAYSVGIIHSTDGGSSWDISNFNLQSSVQQTQFRQVRYDPAIPNTIWAIENKGKLYKSADGGQSFSELSSPQYGPQVPINPYWAKRFLGDIEIIPTNTNHSKVIVVSANDDNAGNQGGFIQMTLDEGATPWTYITPEPYIERINLDFAKVSGNAPDNFKALYVVNRPTIKITEIAHDLDNATSLPSYIDRTGQYDYVELTNFKPLNDLTNLKNYILQRILPNNSGSPIIEEYKFADVDVYFNGGDVAVICLQSVNTSSSQPLFFSTQISASQIPFSNLSNSDKALYLLFDNSTGRLIDLVSVAGFDLNDLQNLPVKNSINQSCLNYPSWDFPNSLYFSSSSESLQLVDNDNNSSTHWSNSTPISIATLNNSINPPFEIIYPIRHVLAQYDIINGIWTNLQTNNYPSNSGAEGTSHFKWRISKNSLEYKQCDLDATLMAVGGTRGQYSNDNGSTLFESGYNTSERHADIRDIEQIPNSTGWLIATDGGVTKVNYSGGSFTETNLNGKGLALSDLLGIDSPPTEPDKFMFGAFHNGSWIYDNGSWYNSICGDGLEYKYGKNISGLHTTYPELWLGQCNARLPYTDNTFSAMNMPYPNNADIRDDNQVRIKFIHNINGNDIPYLACKVLFKNPVIDNANTIDILNDNIPFSDPNIHFDKLGLITAFDVTAGNNDTIIFAYGGTTSQLQYKIWISYDNAANWNDITSNFPVYTNPPSVFNDRSVSDIVISPNDPNKIWVSFSGFNKDEKKIFYSSDAGLTFNDISGQNLPESPINCLEYQEDSNDGIYAGTDEGVYYIDNTLTDWVCFNNGMPCNMVTDLDINSCGGILRAATYGSGIWESPMVPNLAREITQTEIWDTDKIIEHNVIVKQGGHLIIKNHADIAFGGGVSITVEQNGSLAISDGAILHSECNYMWSGIVSRSFSEVDVKNSIIRDANHAIELSNSSYAYIKNTNFENNTVSIYGNDNPGSVAIGYILGNTFTCTSNLKKNIIDPSGLNLTHPSAGIELNGLQIPFDPYGAPCVFSNLNNGIVLSETDMQIVSCSFDQIKDYEITSHSLNGYAIQANGSGGGYKLSVSGGVQPVSIDHSDNGIRTNHMGVEIESISIDNTDFGIWVQGNEYGLSSLIAHSNLNCNIHGIELWMNIGSTSQKIIGNIINVGSPGFNPSGNAIRIDDSNIINSGIFVNGNIIEANNCKGGITLINASKAKVLENNVTLHDAINNYYGISLYNNESSIVECNTVVGSSSNSASKQRGYIFNKSPNSLVSCNIESNTHFGFEFDDICDNSIFQENIMSTNWCGLYLNSNAVIGVQLSMGNLWDCALPFGSGFEAINQDLPNLNSSEIYVNQVMDCSNSSTNFALSPSNVQPSFNWFSNSTNPPANECALGIVCATQDHPPGEGTSDFDEAVAQNLVSFFDYNDETKTAARLLLYSKLDNNTDLLSSTIYHQFYNTFSNSSVASVKIVHDKMIDSYKADSLSLVELGTYDSLNSAYTNIIDSLNYLIVSDTSGTQTQFLNNQLSYFLDLKTVLKNEGHILFSSLDSISKIHLIDALSINSSISSGDLIINNLKNINDIIDNFRLRSDQTFTESEKIIIDEIASLCPFEGGEAVYKARSLQFYIDPSISYDDIQLCQQYGYLRKIKPEEEAAFKTILSPNPSDGEVTFYLDPDIDLKYTIYIYDSSSRLIFTSPENIQGSVSTISSSNLEDGIYMYKINFSNQKSLQGKFIIMH